MKDLLRKESIEFLGFIEKMKLVNEITDFKEACSKATNLAKSILSHIEGIDKTDLTEEYLEEVDVVTPKIDVRGVIFDKNKILLVKEENETWSIPGGWAKEGQTPKENIVREVLEETGHLIEPVNIIAIYDRNLDPPTYIHRLYKIFFECKIKNYNERNGEFESNYFDMEDLPAVSNTKTNFRQIKQMFEYLNDKTKKIYFD